MEKAKADINSPDRSRENNRVFIVFLIFVLISFLVLFLRSRDNPEMPPHIICGVNLKGLGLYMHLYADIDEQGKITPDKWCDLLIEGRYGRRAKEFVCPSSGAIRGESSYAMNINVADNFRAVRPAIVLLFETNFGIDPNGRQALLKDRRCFPSLRYGDPETRVHRLRWNQLGGPEILTTENHKGKGCNVLFADGSVKFVKTQNLGNLKWK
jgi:prepilin-type processing-associated H-X9-DG protein